MTPVEHRILRGLAKYRYLTIAQMQAAKIGRDRKNLSERLSRLTRAGFIGVLKWGVYPTLGRLPWMYYLKAKGERVLAEYERREPSETPYVRASDPKLQMDHFHRRYTVDCHIALNQWASATKRKISFFWPYYSKRYGSVPRLRLPDNRSFLRQKEITGFWSSLNCRIALRQSSSDLKTGRNMRDGRISFC